jgi:hypothetical protein
MTGQYTDHPTKSFQVGAAIAQDLRVKLTAGKLAVAGDTDSDLGTLLEEAFAADEWKTVCLKNKQGTTRMVAGEAITAHAAVYGFAGGKVGATVNANYLGVAMEAASGNNSVIEVLRQVEADDLDNLGAIDGNLVIDDDFIGDWPAAATALSGQGPYAWSKTETNGLGVISSDEANGVLIFAFDAVAEAATATLFMENSPVDIDKSPVFECRLAIFDIGDDAALDIDFGLASDDHATDFDAIATFAAFHLDGAALSVLCHSDDGTTDTAPVDSTIDLVDNTYATFKIDICDKADVKFFINGTRVLSGTTFDISAYTGALTPIIMVEKTSNDTTADVRADRVRVQSQRN